MKRLMISAMASGSGKTVLTCGLLAALTARGHAAQALKCGPDYIDPMFHEKVLGVPSRNLDLFLQGEDGVRRTLLKQKGDYVVVEGAMGFYDGSSNGSVLIGRNTSTKVPMPEKLFTERPYSFPNSSWILLLTLWRPIPCSFPSSTCSAWIDASSFFNCSGDIPDPLSATTMLKFPSVQNAFNVTLPPVVISLNACRIAFSTSG